MSDQNNVISLRGTEHQPRERAVPCNRCGISIVHSVPRPNNMTWNLSGLCDKHEQEKRDADIFTTVEEIRNDFE